MKSMDLETFLPEDPLRRLRWAMAAVGVGLGVMVLMLLWDHPRGAPALLAATAVALAIGHWLAGARLNRLFWSTDPVSMAAVGAAAALMGPDEPAMALGFGATSFRAVYSERGRLAVILYPWALTVGLGLHGGWSVLASPAVLATLVTLTLMGAMYRVVVAGLQSYEKTRADLTAAHEELEQRVADRTHDLAVANATLEQKVREVEATQALIRRSAEYFRALIENGSDLVMVLRPDGRIRYISPSVERVLGFRMEDVLGQSFAVYVAEEDLPATLQRFNRVLRSPRTPLPLTVQVRHADGGERSLEAIAQNLVEDSAVGGVVLSARDVTDRLAVEQALREQEAELRQAQKMEAVGRLAGGVAHDFNNILTVIGGHAEYLESRLSGQDPLRAEAAEIGGAVERAARLTRQLLVFSRREVAQPRLLQLSHRVRDLENLVERLLPESVRLETRLSDEALRIEVDPGYLEQVVLNLVVNARDAMPEGGSLTIAVEDRDVPEPIAGRFGDIPGGRYVVLTVQDTGCGIPGDVVDRIFDPFFTTKGAGGTGLGLSTVFGITQEAGASIQVETREGHGTRFRVWFPGRDAPAWSEDEREPRMGTGAGETLLVVEDEERLRVIAARGLRERGYAVLAASSAEDALRVASAHPDPIDLLVTDVVMPGLSGPELHRELEAVRGRVPVLYMSGYPGRELERHGIDPVGLLAKPFTGDVLADAARRVLDEG